ncbi:hypothetical protein N431DRAFT_208856 [Stipitochalara longipes BDJ]|nr:hypothetical protein N431DRAFT_208856 [Stipitochalara longipes BDJ]
MFKCKGTAIFILLALVVSVLATTPKSGPESTVTGNYTDEEWVGELWDGYRPDSWSYTRSLKDWSHCNYSSKHGCPEVSVVRWGGKFYDPLSFKGAENDSYAIAFHLSTEVAVSVAQDRNGTLFDVAIVNGSEDYRNMMAQIQQELKGDRSLYYTETDWNPDWRWHDWIGFSTHKNYFQRIYKYLKYGPPPPFSPDPTPVLTTILQSLALATEETLGVKLNYTKNRYDRGIQISAPWEFNETFVGALHDAMDTLATPAGDVWFYGPEIKPWLDWRDHSNDNVRYGGDNGTKMALRLARAAVEMMEYDPEYRYGDFICGTPFVEEEMRIEAEMKANGTWVEPIYKKRVNWECRNWGECWRAWPWKYNLGYNY